MKFESSNDWKIVNIDNYKDERGELSVAEFGQHFDFDVKRIFLLHNIHEDEIRGDHAHLELSQLILCTSGSFKIELDDGVVKKTVELKNDGTGILVGGLVWRKMWQFSADAVMLVLCDRIYKDDTVIRDYSEFRKLLKETRK